MTTLKVNVVRKPTIKVKVLPNFPSSVTATSPILLNRVGGNYAFLFDSTALQTSLNSIYAPALFTQSGTGAVARTVNNKLRDIFSVKDFGAVGDGVTNDAPAILAAVTAAKGTLGAAGAGAAVYFPAGFYKITSAIAIPGGIRLFGDGWSSDAGALDQNQILSSTAGLSGSIILPTSTINGLVFTTNQAVSIENIAVVYISRPAQSSGLTGITVQAAASATSPAPLAWNVDTYINQVWIYGSDRNLFLNNCGHFVVSNCQFHMHGTIGMQVAGPNLPYAGDWMIGPGNQFASGASLVICQHILITSGGGGRIIGNKLNSCGSNNIFPPYGTYGVRWAPNLAVAQNSLEPIVVASNTIEGLSIGLYFDGSFVGQTATATQMTICGNQLWCLQDIVMTPTSTNAQWISGVQITGNYLSSQTVVSVTTTTNNLNLNGCNKVSVVGNTFDMIQGAGGDTSNAINVGAFAASVSQMGNITGTGVSIPTTVPLAQNGPLGTLMQGGSPAAFTVTPTLGIAGTSIGKLSLTNVTSGTITLQPITGALGAATATFPAGAYNVVSDIAAQTLTNKTLTDPLISRIYGGTAAASALTLQSTSNGTPSSDIVNVKGGTINLVTTAAAGTFINLGSAGVSGATVTVAGASSGSQVWQTAAAASGTATMFAGTDTVVGKATTDIFTNKTYDTAGTGNVFKINGVTISANTGTGSNVLATSPTITNDLAVTGFVQTGGFARVSTQFDKTSSTTLSDITGLTVTVGAGLTYEFEAYLFYTANSASGVKCTMAGTCTATNIIFETFITNTSGFTGIGKQTALGAVSTGSTPSIGDVMWMRGTITVNAGGTLTAQFAQNVSGGVASSVLVGSTMKVFKIA